MMTPATLLSAGYGILLIGGGYMGYSKAGSTVSLAMGLISGAIILYCAYGFSIEKESTPLTALIASLALLAVFGIRFYKTGAMMPAGMMGMISLGMSAFFMRSL